MTVLKEISQIIEEQGAMHLSLIDPDPHKARLSRLPDLVSAIDKGGTDGFMVGGSTALDSSFVTKVVQKVKERTEKPVILFPSGPGGLSKVADAIFFMMPLNSVNNYFLGKVQALGAPIIMRKNLEAISMAYLIFEPGGSAGFVCEANPLPRGKPEIAIGYSMAADLLGFDLIYLEAGSGATKPIPTEIIAGVRKRVETPIIVGGGIRSPMQAAKAVKAGGNIIVQGTRLETPKSLQEAKEEVKQTVSTMKNIKEGGT